MSLLFKTAETFRQFSEERSRFSWSKWKTINLCPARWFGENFAVWDEPQAIVKDGLYSISGSLIQRVWEAFINDRVYKSLPSTPEAWLKWLDNATQHLYRLIVKPLDAQYDPPYANHARTFFITKTGKHQLELALKNGLPENFRTGLQLQFVDIDDFKRVYGSEEKFFSQLRDAYTKTLSLFFKYGVNLDAILSETYIEVNMFDHLKANGSVDFLVQPGTLKSVFSDIRNLEDGYTLLDGKISFGKTLDQEQLFYYAAIIQFKYKRTARYVGFINWTEGRFVFYDYLPAYAYSLRHKLKKTYDYYTPLEQTLKGAVTQPTTDLEELPYLKFTPSLRSCAYCSLMQSCKAAKKIGIVPKVRDKSQSSSSSEEVLDFSDMAITEDSSIAIIASTTPSITLNTPSTSKTSSVSTLVESTISDCGLTEK